MIAHVVLLQPKPDLTEQDRTEALATIRAAAAQLPDVRRVLLGKRLTHGLPGYEQLMSTDFEYSLIVEVDDRAALERYLRAPAHDTLAGIFYTASAAALAYDYVTEDIGPA